MVHRRVVPGRARGAAAICDTTPKTVRRVIERHEAGAGAGAQAAGSQLRPGRRAGHGQDHRDQGADVGQAAAAAGGRRRLRGLGPEVPAAGRRGEGRVAPDPSPRATPGGLVPGRAPGPRLGRAGRAARVLRGPGLLRVRFVRFAADERAATTMSLLAECFETLGGVPKVVLADRMACLRADVVAGRVVPTPDYVRFASHYRFRPDFCEGHDPESKGIVENLVGYAKADLMIGCGLVDAGGGDRRVDLAAANAAAARWCAEVNAAAHSEIAAVPAERLAGHELALLGGLPALRLRIGGPAVFRKVDRLSCVRYGSARYSVPSTAIGHQVEVRVHHRRARVLTCAASQQPQQVLPVTRSSPPARSRSSTRTIRRPARRSQRGRSGRKPPQRRRSARWARRPRRS